ncbi:hypothetical protein [Vibrio phage PhiImVa-1]|nr:hypothetical protein [Vibrio phage PhiImVa-1]
MTQVKVLSATDKSSKALLAAAGSVEAAIKLAQETLPALLVEIENKQSDLNAIESETKEKVRKAKVELSLQVEENERKVLENLMKKFGLAEITVEAVSQLRSDLEAAVASNEAEVKKAVAIAVSQAESAHKAEIARLESEHAVAVANKNAAIEAKDMQLEFQARTISSLEATITAEREARVKEAEARSNSQVVVNTSAK